MVIVKVIKNSNPENNYLMYSCEYVFNPEKAIDTGGYGVSSYNAHDAYNQMVLTKKYFNKTSGNPLVHIVISYDKSVNDAQTACQMSKQCASYYADNYQLLYCTHEKERENSNYHTHIIVNSVNYNNGLMFNSNIPNMNQFCDYVSNVTGQKTKLYF